MLPTQGIHTILCLVVACLHLSGCIGENPPNVGSDSTGAAATATTSASASTSTPTGESKAATAPQLEPGTPGVPPAVYEVTTPSSDILRYYMQDYAKLNTSLDDRDAHADKKNIAAIHEKLTRWSDPNTQWGDEYGNQLTTPLDNEHIKILYDGGGSILATDNDHVVQRLELEQETGVFIAPKTSINTAQLKLNPTSWIDVRGRLGAIRFEMNTGSLIDLTNGYGMEVNTEIDDLTVDTKSTETGIFNVESAGHGKINGGTITLHKATINGTLKLKDATFNFQTRRDHKTEDIGFMLTNGQLEVIQDEETLPKTMMTVNGSFKFGKDASIKLPFNNERAPQIKLNYPFSIAGLTEDSKPNLEGTFEFAPTVAELTPTTSPGILILKSNTAFVATLDLRKAILHDEILGHKLTLVATEIDADDLDEEDDYTHGVYLNISSLPTSLSRHMVSVIRTFKHAQLDTTLTQPKVNLFNAHNTNVNLLCFKHIDSNKYETTQLSSLAFEVEKTARSHSFIWQQSFTHTRNIHIAYKYLPELSSPFWQFHSFCGIKRPLTKILSITGGLSYLYVPTTLLQAQLHGFFPETSVKFTLPYTKTSPISTNLLVNTTYNGYHNTFINNYGVIWGIKTLTTNISCTLLNPLQASMSFKFEISLSL